MNDVSWSFDGLHSCNGLRIVGSGVKLPPFLFYPHPVNWKFPTLTLFTFCLTFVHILLVHTVMYIEPRFCAPFTNNQCQSPGELHHYQYYLYCGSYFQGNLQLPLPQIYKMLSNLLQEKDLHPFYFVSTLFSEEMSTPPYYQFSKSQTGTL